MVSPIHVACAQADLETLAAVSGNGSSTYAVFSAEAPAPASVPFPFASPLAIFLRFGQLCP